MFWRGYGSVVGWMFMAGMVAGGVSLLAFAWLVPPDRGEESVVLFVPFIGALFGALTAAAAALLYGVCLALWIRRGGRSVGSRAGAGATGAACGALGLWLGLGYAISGGSALPLWGGLGGFSAAAAIAVVWPLTARASRRADRRSVMTVRPESTNA